MLIQLICTKLPHHSEGVKERMFACQDIYTPLQLWGASAAMPLWRLRGNYSFLLAVIALRCCFLRCIWCFEYGRHGMSSSLGSVSFLIASEELDVVDSCYEQLLRQTVSTRCAERPSGAL